MGKNDDAMTKAPSLPNETLTTIMICLQSCMNNVSPECQEAIITVTANCTLLLKSRQQPALVRSRAVDGPFGVSGISGQLYNHSGVDTIPGLTTNLANMTMSGPTSSAFNLPGGLGPLVQSPGSPSRILGAGPSNSPFPMMPMQHQGPVGTSSSLVLGVNQIGNIGRMGPASNIDKSRIPEYNLFPEMSPNVSKDIEDEANSYFQRIYNHPPHPTLSIDEVLEMLKRFQDSHNKREREVSRRCFFFNCRFLCLIF
jgi:CCR4-NOT transcription complex subunit 1